jgi:hypothetical protein
MVKKLKKLKFNKCSDLKKNLKGYRSTFFQRPTSWKTRWTTKKPGRPTKNQIEIKPPYMSLAQKSLEVGGTDLVGIKGVPFYRERKRYWFITQLKT